MSDDDEQDGPLGADRPSISASDRREMRARERKQLRDEHAADEFWIAALGTEVGRREIWKLVAQCHPFETKFASGPNGFPSPEASAFHRGQQQYGQWLLRSMQLRDLPLAMLMQQENDPGFAKVKRRRRKAKEQGIG